MVANSLYPGFMKFRYSSGGLTHYHTVPVNWGNDAPAGLGMDLYDLLLYPSGAVDAETFCNNYALLISNFFNTASEIQYAEFWAIPTIGADAIFMSGLEIGIPGLGAPATILNSQLTFTWRTSLGGILRSVFMDTNFPVNVQDFFPYTSVSDSFSDYMLGSTCPIIGRDGGRVIAGIKSITKTNDALRKKRLLGA